MRRPQALAYLLGTMVALGGCSGASTPAAAASAKEEGDTDHAPAADEDADEFAFDEETPDDGHTVDPDSPAGKAHVDITAATERLQSAQLELEQETAELAAASDELTKRLEAVASLEKRLDERMGLGETSRRRREQRISVLAKLLLAMPPQSAASMVAELSEDDAKSIILAMSAANERKASKLLAAMPTDRAAALGQLYLDHDPKVPGGAPPQAQPQPPDSTTPAEAAGKHDASAPTDGETPS